MFKKTFNPPNKFLIKSITYSLLPICFTACVELNQVVDEINSAINNSVGGVVGAVGMGGATPTEAQKQQISQAVQSYRGSNQVLRNAINEAAPNLTRILTYFACNPYYRRSMGINEYPNGLGSLVEGTTLADIKLGSIIHSPLGDYEEKSAFHPRDKCLNVRISRWGSLDASNNYKYAESLSAMVHYSSDYSNHRNTNPTFTIRMMKDKGRWKVHCHTPYYQSSNHAILGDANKCGAFELDK